jgi:hypothetical protein
MKIEKEREREKTTILNDMNLVAIGYLQKILIIKGSNLVVVVVVVDINHNHFSFFFSY